MQDQQPTPPRQNKTVILTAVLVLAVIAVLAVFGVIMSSRPKDTEPTPAPTRNPIAVMQTLVGDWTQTKEDARGLVTMSLHGDNTARFTFHDIFNAEPVGEAGRWSGSDGVITLITADGAFTDYTFTLESDTLTLTDSNGISVSYRRAAADPAPAE